MSEQRGEAGHEHIVGELRIEPGEVQQVSREATTEQRRLIALNSVGIGAVLAALAVNYFEGESLMKSFLLPCLVTLLSILSLSTQITARRRRIANIAHSQPPGFALRYQLDPSGIDIQDAVGAKRVAWNECNGFDESAHAFLLYAGGEGPEVVHKRAFREHELALLRARLQTNVKQRTAGRALVLTLLMGFGILALGVIVAVAARGAGH